jgi:precorrin-6A synthase
MRRLLAIGIGSGDPDHLTQQAVKAMQTVDVVFAIRKTTESEELLRIRREICERYLGGRQYRVVEIPDVERDRRPANYVKAVEDWHAARCERLGKIIREALREDQCGAFLVWGDPGLYDSMVRLLAKLSSLGLLEFEWEVIPGISSIQVLAARHRIALNDIGESITVTTGRKLVEMDHIPAGGVVVMLDGQCAFRSVKETETYIYWGAYLGTADEMLISGKLADVAETIERLRTQARERKGWIMDTYLLRRDAGRIHS